MRSLLRILLGLIIATSLGLGSVAHAGEASAAAIDLCAESVGHDSDTSGQDSDADKVGLHGHGGCHGHHQFDALGRGDAAALTPVRGLNFAANGDFLPQLVPDANLRPPIA